MNLLQIFKRNFSENIQGSATDVSCKISELLKTIILKNNRGQLLLYCLFYFNYAIIYSIKVSNNQSNFLKKCPVRKNIY